MLRISGNCCSVSRWPASRGGRRCGVDVIFGKGHIRSNGGALEIIVVVARAELLVVVLVVPAIASERGALR